MTSVDFLAAFADAVGVETREVTLDTELGKLETWDSVAYLSIMTVIDENMGVALDPEGLANARVVGDIYNLALSQRTNAGQ